MLQTTCLKNVTVHGSAQLTFKGACHIGEGSILQCDGGLTLGHGVIISYDCVLWTINHDYTGDCLPYTPARVARPIVLGDYVWVGRNAQIAPGAQIGEGAIIGMGAVVAGNIPALAIVAGNPARIVGYRSLSAYRAAKQQPDLWQQVPSGQCPACESGDLFYVTSRYAHPRRWKGITWPVWLHRLRCQAAGLWTP